MRYGLALVFLGVVLVPVGQTAGDKKITIYESLGAEKGITQLVEDFFGFIVADPKIRKEHKEYFVSDNARLLKPMLVALLCEATGGPQKYKGKSMIQALKGMKVTNADFDAFVDNVKKSLVKNKVAVANQEYLLRALNGMRKDVVEVPAKSTQLPRPASAAPRLVRGYSKWTASVQ